MNEGADPFEGEGPMSLRPYVLPVLVLALLTAACDDGVAPEPVATLEALGPTQHTAVAGRTLPDPLVVRALTETGVPVEGVAVTWEATHGELSESTTVTDVTGRASVAFTLGETAGGQQVTASAGEDLQVVYAIDARAGPPARVVIQPDSVLLAQPGDTAVVTAVAEDEFGNAVPTLPLAFSSADPGVAVVEATEEGQAVVEAVAAGRTELAARTGTIADTVAVIVGGGS